MARLKFSLPTGGKIAVSAATAKTVLQARTPTNHVVALIGFSVMFDGAVGTNVPALVELVRYSSNGTMTSAATYKDDTGRDETIQTGGFKTATLEPAVDSVIRNYLIHPQTGYDRHFDYDEEIIVPGSSRIGLRVTAPDAVNVAAQLHLEE